MGSRASCSPLHQKRQNFVIYANSISLLLYLEEILLSQMDYIQSVRSVTIKDEMILERKEIMLSDKFYCKNKKTDAVFVIESSLILAA